MVRPQIVITDYICDDLLPETQQVGEVADLVALDAHHESELIGRIEEADALMVYHNLSLTPTSLARLRHCKLIVRVGVGYDNVDGADARRRGIPLVNIPDYGTEEVADTAIGMMLTLTRGILQHQLHLRQQAGPWSFRAAAPLRRLRGQVFAIVGLGRIGTAAALRAKALGMDVVYYDPYLPDGYDKALGVRRAESLEGLLRQAFVLSLHCPLTVETRRMICPETIGWMPAGAYLVNTARGPIVDTSILPAALANGQLAGVAPDVLPVEPPAADDPLVRAWHDPQHPAFSRLILNPHASFYCEEGLLEMRRKAARACRQALTGQPLRNVVN